MRTLIDGYNLMYAVGLLGKRFGPEGFRKTRHRFLNDLSSLLGPVAAHQTTVVFDAAHRAEELPGQTTHQGLSVLYAVGDESADERIEALIAHHSAPKNLTVVSSDHRIQRAATRRKAQAVSSEAFWSRLNERRPAAAAMAPLTPEEQARLHGLSSVESAAWLDVFGHVVELPGARDALGDDDFIPTAEEIARIEREVERERWTD
jgi:predicted RNA-binding protein with PIN domain